MTGQTIKIFFTLLFVSVLLQAQTEQLKTLDPIVKIGIKGGYSLGKLTARTDNIYSQDYESVSGVDFGLTFEFEINERFSMQPEINFVSRGGVRTGFQPVTGNELSEQLNNFLPFYGFPEITNENPLYADFINESALKYLEFPVLLKMGWGDNFRFFAEVGPYVGILLKATQQTSGYSKFYLDSDALIPAFVPQPDGGLPFIELPEQNLTADTDVKDNLKTVNFGGVFGLGVSKKIGIKGELFLDARASYSFHRIQIRQEFGKSYIGAIVFSAGYAYNIF